jgi:hypothetical protein
MLSKNMQWILWAISMLVFLVLMLGGHTMLLGLTLIAVAIIWYTIVPQARSRRQ